MADEKKKIEELTDEELNEAAGGAGNGRGIICAICGKEYNGPTPFIVEGKQACARCFAKWHQTL